MVEVVLRHELIVLDLDFLVDWVALKNDLLALSILREVLGHVLLNVLGVVASLLDAFQYWLPFLIGQSLFFIFDFLNGLIDITMVVAQFRLLLALGSGRNAR